jgi:hypothetical protein
MPAAAEMLATAGTPSIEGIQSISKDASNNSDARNSTGASNSSVFAEICKKLSERQKLMKMSENCPFCPIDFSQSDRNWSIRSLMLLVH